MIKVGLLGHIAKGKCIFDGQTVKTRELLNELENDEDILVDVYDTYYLRKSKYRLCFYIFRFFLKNDVLIISLSWNGYRKILPFIYFLNLVFKRRIFDFVIGGCRHEYLSKQKNIIKYVKLFEKIYVESNVMVDAYKRLGLTSVDYMPNFKNMIIYSNNSHNKSNILRICTFSRICKEKGIEDAIDAVNLVNDFGHNIKCTLTIYGSPDIGYEKKFEELKKIFPSYIKYGGLIEYGNSSRVLRDFDILLFPTFHIGEGFPGTILDAYAAGLAVIASEWNFNSELIDDNKNGFLVPVNNIEEIANKIRVFYEDRNLLEYCKHNCSKKAKYYHTHNVLKSFVNRVKQNVK